MISCVGAKMGGVLGSRVACRVCLPSLFRVVCAVLDRAGGIFGARGKSAFVAHRNNVCERRGISLGRAGPYKRKDVGPQCAERVSRGPFWPTTERGGPPGPPRETVSIFPASRARRDGHGPRASARPRGRALRAARHRLIPVAPGPARRRGEAGAKTPRVAKKKRFTVTFRQIFVIPAFSDAQSHSSSLPARPALSPWGGAGRAAGVAPGQLPQSSRTRGGSRSIPGSEILPYL